MYIYILYIYIYILSIAYSMYKEFKNLSDKLCVFWPLLQHSYTHTGFTFTFSSAVNISQ